jgi:hypothetical protein
MPEIPIRIIQDPVAAEGCIALLHNHKEKTLSFRLWDLSLDFNYNPKCLKRERQRRFITEYILDESLNDSIDEQFQKPTVLGKKRTELGGKLSLNFGHRTPLTRYITIVGILGAIKIDTFETKTSILPHMEIEVDDDRLTREEHLSDDGLKYSMYSAILHEDYHTVKEYFLQQNIAETKYFVDEYFPYAVQAKSAPEFFDIFFSSGINPNMIYHQKEPIAGFLGCGLELLRNKEFVDVLIKHKFDFNYQTSKAKDGVLELLVEVSFFDLPIVGALIASSPCSEFGKWHAACRYIIDVGGADIDAKLFDYKDLPNNVMSHPEKHKEFCRENGMTILAYASCKGFGSRHIVQQLLELGADPDIKYKGQYIWDFCKDEYTSRMVRSAHILKAKGHIPIHLHRKIFFHEGLKLFVMQGPLEYLQAALDIGANPDIFDNVREICKDEAKCEVIEKAAKYLRDRLLRRRQFKLDTDIRPSRRGDLSDIQYDGDPAFSRLLKKAKQTKSREDVDEVDLRYLSIQDKMKKEFRKEYPSGLFAQVKNYYDKH